MTIQLALAALGGLFIGSAIAFAVNAQKAPPAYFIAESVVTNPQADSAVIAKLPATAEPYGGKYLARGGDIVSFGGEPPKRLVIVAFNSMAQAQAWRADPPWRRAGDVLPPRSRRSIWPGRSRRATWRWR